MKPIVGVMPLWDDEKDSIWMLPGYMDGISQAGGIPIMFPFTQDERELEQLVNLCDGFLFTGGHDVSPELYHEKPIEGIVVSCIKRDVMESIVLRKVLEQDQPVHVVNVVAGSPMEQYLGVDQLAVNSCHHQAVSRLAPALKAMAYAPDGLVEAVYMPEKKFLWAVQWHPEFSYRIDVNSRRIFQAFAEAMII